jgi:hypothetical protein
MLLGAGLARATTVMIPTDDDMIVGARSIVRANVISVGSADDGHSAWVCTYIKLRVLDVLKGPIATRDIVIKEPGGQIASRGSVIFGTPQFTAGEQVILFLDTWPDGSLRVHNIFLGKYSVIKDSSTGQTTVVRDTPGPNVEVLIDKSNPPQSTSTSRMELSAFTHMVRKKLAANWTQSVEFEARYYPGVPQLISPPEYEPKAAEGKIEAQFHLFNPAVRHFEPDSGQPVVYQVNPAGAPSTQIMDDVGAAMNAWSSVPVEGDQRGNDLGLPIRFWGEFSLLQQLRRPVFTRALRRRGRDNSSRGRVRWLGPLPDQSRQRHFLYPYRRSIHLL